MEKYVIVVASGTGSRMHSKVPKQYMLLENKPIIVHTILRIHSFDSSYNIVVVINKEHQTIWADIKEKYNLSFSLDVIYGGQQRFFSVKNAVDYIASKTTNALVAVHDAVRPFVTKRIFDEGFLLAQDKGSAVCCVKPTDSIRIIDDEQSIAKDRNLVRLVQTPQIFSLNILHKAYTQDYRMDFTDDASVVECSGKEICLYEGERQNIKITYQEDILFAQLILKQNYA